MKIFRLGVAAAVASLFVAGTALAVPITVIKVGLGETGPDVAYVAPAFGTSDDGNAATTGMQDTDIDFTGFLSGMADILSGASFTLANVLAVGPANVVGPIISQSTVGGTFALYDASNTLLLSGGLGTGAINGSTVSSTGGFFNVTTSFYTGGTLLPLLLPTPAGISFSFTAVTTAGLPGLGVDGQGNLKNFSADATGNLDAEAAVPEPMTLGLLSLGLLGGAVARRRRA